MNTRVSGKASMGESRTIEVAEGSGACFGVNRALDITDKLLNQKRAGNIYTLGNLIHNKRVCQDLEDRGVSTISEEDFSKLSVGDTVVIRSHGVPPKTIEHAKSLGLNATDATCPFVKKVHFAAQRFQEDGRRVVIVGEKGHPEVEGTSGYVKDALIVGSANELPKVSEDEKIGVVVQTTQTKELLDSIVTKLKEMCANVEVANTICEATTLRQNSVDALSKKVDVMIVIGGKNSANTCNLAEISKRHTKTHHIESAEEICNEWFSDVQKIGICAGASTPKSQIEDVIQMLYNRNVV